MNNQEKYNLKDYTKKYTKEHYKVVNLPLRKELYDIIVDYAATNNDSVEGFIKWCIKETIKRDKEGGKGERL